MRQEVGKKESPEFFVTGFAFDSFYAFVEDAGILNPLLIHAGFEY